MKRLNTVISTMGRVSKVMGKRPSGVCEYIMTRTMVPHSIGAKKAANKAIVSSDLRIMTLLQMCSPPL